MLPNGLGINTAENAKSLEGKKVLSAPTEVHWGSDTTLEQVPGVSTSDVLGISLCQRHLTAVLINCTEVNSCGELLQILNTAGNPVSGVFVSVERTRREVFIIYL